MTARSFSGPDLRARAAARAAAAGRALLDFVLPPHCVTCDQPVGAPGQFCAACFGKTAFISAPCCDACGTGLASASYGALCARCQEHRPIWGSARAALAYDDQTRRVVLPFKYGDRTEIARALAPLMARSGAALLARADLLAPVPLHRWRLLGRRYNQSALLAQAIGRIAGRPAVPDLLCRVRRTPPLGTLSPRRRKEVLEGVFEVNERRRAMLADARVLLIDDVLTTGSTAEACTRALLEAGAGSVDVLAAARVPDWQAG